MERLMFSFSMYRLIIETSGCLNTLHIAFQTLKTTEPEETIKEPWIEKMESEKAFEMVTEETNGEAANDHEELTAMRSSAQN